MTTTRKVVLIAVAVVMLLFTAFTYIRGAVPHHTWGLFIFLLIPLAAFIVILRVATSRSKSVTELNL